MKKRYFDFLSLVITGILYVFSVLRVTIIPMHAPVKPWQMLLFATGALLFYCLVNTKAGRIVFLSATGVGLAYVAFLIYRNGISNIPVTLAPAIKLINVMIQVGTGYYDNTISYSLLMKALGAYSLLVALPVYYFLIRYFRFYLLFTPGLVVFMTVWGLIRYVDRLSFFIFITVAIICYIRHIYLVNMKKNRSKAVDASMFVYFVPVAVAVILLAVSAPVNEKPIEWPWLDDKIYNFWWDMKKKLTIDRYDNFSLANTGFGDPYRLGGPVYPDDTPILFVKAPTRVYLRGAVYDTYTGTGWEKTEKSKELYLEDRIYDHRELSYGWKATSMVFGFLTAEEYDQYLLNQEVSSVINDFSTEEFVEFLQMQSKPRVLAKLFPEEKLSVEHLQVRTKSLFTPLKMFVPITGIPTNIYTLNEGVEGIFLSDKRLRGGTYYDINYLQPAYGMREIENHFNLSRPDLYAEFNDYLERFIEEHEDHDNQGGFSQQLYYVLDIYKLLERYSEEVYSLYTGIPDGVPERVIELANEITSSYTTAYAKVKSLANYLRENYHYTLNPSYPPSDRDFVDYFLFEGKEGYCSYFASALCVMTRAIGIPSRYVEGFLLPEKSGRDNSYLVTNQNAHAWVEVYLEGVGWVTFEPTPPMANAMNYYVSLRDTGTGESSYVPDMYEEYEPEDSSPNIFIPGNGGIISDSPVITAKTILVFAVAFVLAVIILNKLFILARWVILHFISSKKSIIMSYRYSISLLSQAGCILQPGHTPRDYAEIIDERYQFKCMNMSDMVELYYSVRFGSHDADKRTVKRVISFTSEVKAKTGKNMYFIKRFLYRNLLFKG